MNYKQISTDSYNNNLKSLIKSKLCSGVLVVIIILIHTYFIYALFLFYLKIHKFAISKYNVNLSHYEDKLKEIFNLIRDSSNYIKEVKKLELNDMNNIIVRLSKRKVMFNLTDGTKFCAVSDDNKIIATDLKSEITLPLFFYPYQLSCKIFDTIDKKLFNQYKIIAKNWLLFPNLSKVLVFYLKPTYDGFHLYFWVENSNRFYAGIFHSVSKYILQDIDRKLVKFNTKKKYLENFSISQIDLSFKKILVRIE